MSMIEDIRINNCISRARLLVQVEKLQQELSILYDRIEGYTQFMSSEEIARSDKLFEEFMNEGDFL